MKDNKIATCDECGEPATRFVRDVRDTTAPGAQWKTYEPYGRLRRGCDKHPVYPYEYSIDGDRLGRMTDDDNRPITKGEV